jgi:hypothetical protein
MWDNRCTMHRGTEFDDLRWKRDVQRATVSDVANSCEQEGIEIAAAQISAARVIVLAPLPRFEGYREAAALRCRRGSRHERVG